MVIDMAEKRIEMAIPEFFIEFNDLKKEYSDILNTDQFLQELYELLEMKLGRPLGVISIDINEREGDK